MFASAHSDLDGKHLRDHVGVGSYQWTYLKVTTPYPKSYKDNIYAKELVTVIVILGLILLLLCLSLLFPPFWSFLKYICSQCRESFVISNKCQRLESPEELAKKAQDESEKRSIILITNQHRESRESLVSAPNKSSLDYIVHPDKSN
ncbi:hypothetical protein Ciccas_005406 [Cichlidogyrus casuarinus]|uniref:Uncharacterized protein n=1 Tax=Cichlidogyrus casuarinus TaxID=1844966 RepID=A0ABD2Q8R6_9PLAT